MTPAHREQILQALWPEGAQSKLSVWGILDCARDPKIYGALLASNLEFRCLYSGKLPRALEMVAPQLVELFPDNRLTARWIDEGWGQAWGVFIQIDDASNLRHHLRKLLMVRSEAGQRLLFRFYDPRVLRVYLPTCLQDELLQVFGPIKSYLTEGEAANEVQQFGVGPSGLRRQTVALTPND
jgi:Domain of unknown function (DUF4123)